MDTRLIAEEKCHSQCWLCPLERFDLELLGIFKPNPSDRNSGEGGGRAVVRVGYNWGGGGSQVYKVVMGINLGKIISKTGY